METITFLIVLTLVARYINIRDDIKTDGNEVIFEFASSMKKLLFGCSMGIIIVAVVISILYLIVDGIEIGLPIVFTVFAVLVSLVYLVIKNKKIIFREGYFYSFSIFGKQRIHVITDIKEAIEKPSDCMKLVFNDGSKIKIDTIMNNYEKIKEILNTYNINFTDSKGNVKPMGW